MKSIFDINDDLTYNKPDYKLSPNDECVPYMHQRWLSFIDPVYCHLLNEIYNMKVAAFTDNQQFYDFMKCILPRKKAFKIKYIKKTKVTADPANEDAVEELANILEISKKEVREMLSINKDVLKSFKEDLKILKKKE